MKTSFLGSDNIESQTGADTDKVLSAHNRFFVGTIGSSVIQVAAAAATVLSGNTLLRDLSQYHPPKDYGEYLQQVASTLPLICPYEHRKLVRALNNGSITNDQKRKVEASSGILVVLDIQRGDFVEADFGTLLPVRSDYGFTLTILSSERCYRFGVDDPQDLGPVTTQIAHSPFEWAARQLLEGRQLVESHGHIGTVGDLGACCIANEDGIKFRTTFTSLIDALRWHYPPLDV